MVPSKELVQAVLGSDTIIAVLESPVRANTLRIEDTQYGYYGVNTHTFAHQVKEWAFSHKYVLKSGYTSKIGTKEIISYCTLDILHNMMEAEIFNIIGEGFKEANTIILAGEEVLRRLDESTN